MTSEEYNMAARTELKAKLAVGAICGGVVGFAIAGINGAVSGIVLGALLAATSS